MSCLLFPEMSGVAFFFKDLMVDIWMATGTRSSVLQLLRAAHNNKNQLVWLIVVFEGMSQRVT